MTRAPGTYWTFWPNPDEEIFGNNSYQWGFLLKVDLAAIVGLLVLFAIPPIQAWTGCDLRIIATGFAIQFFYAVILNFYGLSRVNPRGREFGSHLVNMIAVVAIPLSSEKNLVVLWLLYLLVVWMDGFSNSKSVSSLLTSVAIPWLDPLWHAGEPAAFQKAMMAGVSVSLGIVIYLVASYFTAWSRLGARAAAENARRNAAVERERALSEERERIGRSLHGTLGAALSEITLWHEVALAGGAGNPERADDADDDPLSRAHARAKSALTELRELVAGMDDESRATVTAANLAAGIRRQTEGLCAAAGVRLDFLDPPDGATDMAAAYHIAKIAVEAATNAVRHARPARLEIALALSPLRLSVRDDGTGFDPAAVPHGRGLRSLREHADSLGASLAFDSAPGAGTRLIVTAAPPKTLPAFPENRRP